MADEKLQNYFKFTDADLQVNKAGHFSQSQMDRLAAQDRADARSNRIAGVLCFVAALLGIGAAIWSLTDAVSRFVFGVGWPLVSVLIGLFILRRSSTKRTYKLGRTQGVLKYSRHINKRTGNAVIGWQILHVGKTRFDVGEHLDDLMHEGETYLVFYYPRQGMSHILSAEQVPVGMEDDKTANHEI